MADTFTKRRSAQTASLVGEAAALDWLAEAEAAGGIRVAKVISATETELVIERIETRAATEAAAIAAGIALAHMHAAGAAYWGCPPGGWTGGYRIGASLTPCAPAEDAPATWGSFYADYRIRAYLAQLPEGFFSEGELARWDALCQCLEEGVFDAPQPALVKGEVARVHGDLWSGNLLWDADPANATGGALIDPMAHGGHAEEDLAMLTLFGVAYMPAIMRGYESVSPLAAGWQRRVLLMQIAPLLLHCVLFGASYRAQTLGTLEGTLRYV